MDCDRCLDASDRTKIIAEIEPLGAHEGKDSKRSRTVLIVLKINLTSNGDDLPKTL